jgi:hypothetical protein
MLELTAQSDRGTKITMVSFRSQDRRVISGAYGIRRYAICIVRAISDAPVFLPYANLHVDCFTVEGRRRASLFLLFLGLWLLLLSVR